MTERSHLFAQSRPATTPRQERRIRVAMVVALLAGIAYLSWRLTTLNPEALALSLLLWSAEAWTFVTAGLLFFATWDPFHREPPPPAPAGKTVDVFVPTLNEPVWVVRRALVGAIAIQYPHRTWLLDDADRPEMRELAEQLGAGYLPRSGSDGAKAGHLNYALERTDGEFVAFFDADHVAVPEFLDRTLGYFDDERVAIVQTPQEFYNVDSYEHDLNERRRRSWHEQTLFYRLIQPGKDRWNAAFFCGSNGVIRRAALEDVGGFPTDSITEDIYLSLRLHARGWRSVYQREVLAYGLAPQTAVAHLTQRLRWGQGGMQVLRKANPLTLPGLTLAQRLQYLMSFLPWFDGWQKLIFYLIPPVFMVTGVLPIRAEAAHFAVAFVGAYSLLLLASKWAARGTAKLLLSDAYHAAAFYTYIKATFGLFARKRLKFAVTDKEGQDRVPVGTVAPVLALIGASLLALGIGLWRFTAGQIPHVAAFWANAAWISLNLGLLGWGVWHMLTKRERRGVHRVTGGVPVDWAVGAEGGLGLLEDFSETGGRLRVKGTLPADGYVLVTFWPALYQQGIGKIRWRRVEGAQTVAGLEWLYVAPGGSPADLVPMAMLFAQRRFLHLVDYATDSGSQPDPIPVRTLSDDSRGVLERLTSSRGRLLLGAPRPVGERVEFAPWDASEVLVGTVEGVHRLELLPYPAYEVDLCEIGTAGHQARSRATSALAGRGFRVERRLEHRHVRLGVTVGDLASADSLALALGHELDIVQVRWSGLDHPPVDRIGELIARGREVVLAWTPPIETGLLRLGLLDLRLRRWFAAMADMQATLHLRPDLPGPHRERQFVRLQQLAAASGARNLRWIWSPEDAGAAVSERFLGDVHAVSANLEIEPHAAMFDLHERFAEGSGRPVWLFVAPGSHPQSDIVGWLHAVLDLGALPDLDAIVVDEKLPPDTRAPLVSATRLLAQAARASADR